MGNIAPISIGFDVQFDEAIAAASDRGVVLPETYYGQLQGVARQMAFSVAGIAKLDQIHGVKASLDKAAAAGLSFAEWKKEASVADLGLPKHRLDNIFRTNLQGCYMAGKWEQIDSNKANRPYLMYDAINDTRARPAHLAMDGAIRPVDDPWWHDHSPPNGYRCRCSVVTLSESQARDRSGPNEGLNKTPRLPDGQPAQPDKGWNYSPRDRSAGVDAAIDNRRAVPGMSAEMLRILEDSINASLAQLYAEWVAEYGEAQAQAIWRDNYGSKPIPG